MIRCSKCDELKEENQYSTYYHSTQKKHRTRKVCKKCFNDQKAIYRFNKKNINMEQVLATENIIQPVQDLTPPQEYIQCVGCKEFKSPDDYYEAKRGRYPGKKLTRCKLCNSKYYLAKVDRLRELKGEKVKPVPNKINTYADEFQKVNTFLIMETMGWVFNENGIWSKEGVKDKDKNWAFKELPTYVAPRLLGTRVKGVNTHPAFNHVDEIKELLKKGYTYLYVCRHFQMSKPTLSKILKLDGKKENDA